MKITNSDFDLPAIIEFFNSPGIRLSEEKRVQRFQIDNDVVERANEIQRRLACVRNLFDHRSYFINLYCCPSESTWRVGQAACFTLSPEYQRELMNWLDDFSEAVPEISKQVVIKPLDMLNRCGNVHYTRFPLRVEFERFHTLDSVCYLRLAAIVIGNDGVYIVSYVYFS